MFGKRYILPILIISLCLCPAVVFAGEIIMKGSTSVLPIAQRLATKYMEENPNVRISVSGGGSGDGIKALLDGEIDIANSSRFFKDSEKENAVDKKIYPVPFAIAYDCIVPVVHPDNPVENLTLQQLKDIYSGRISNWKYVGGPDKRIVVVSRNSSSGTFDVWENKVMDERGVTRFVLYEGSNAEVVAAVSADRDAIGYVAIGYLDDSVKGLDVNGFAASSEAALDGSFPINRVLFMFTNGWPTGDLLDFINFVTHPDKGQRYVDEAGFAPLH
ncbi:MAG: phosphate ABC transporter substrate-binding protein [Deltaproteobacteria bacterium]|nr:phosphate ABC transporter substrate-binding protein [Deltaproteobacteria bacterium]